MLQSEKSLFVKDLPETGPVNSTFLVKFSAVAVGKNGKPYMNVVLMDKTGEVEARIWEDVTQHAGQVVRDSLVAVDGKTQLFQGRKQIVIKKIQMVREDEVKLEDYLVESPVQPEKLYEELLGLIGTMEDPYCKALAESVFRDDPGVVEKLKKAPAAKSVHHAYPAGLLEHMVSVGKILDSLAKHYHPILNRDLLFIGGFFHDVAKLWELTYQKVTDYSDEGKLIGHLIMGVELVEKKIQLLEAEPGRLPGAFPEETKILIKHMILSHHGKLEYGSPKRPKCLEALVVHYVDDLDSKINSILGFIQNDQNPGKWTAYNRQYERFFYKADWYTENK